MPNKDDIKWQQGVTYLGKLMREEKLHSVVSV